MKGLGTAAASAAAIILVGAGGAYAADLGMPRKALAAGPAGMCSSILDFFTTDCQVSAYGVRFYGTIDAGFGYQTNTAPLDRDLGPGVAYFLGKNSAGSRWTLAPNGLTQSNVGFQIKEPLGAGWSFVGQVETQFDPETLSLGNSSGSVGEMKGIPFAFQNSYGDGSSQGTFYNGLGFVGISNDTYGTLTFMRQQTLMGDVINSYDPMGSSYAFSMLGYFGAWGGGGDTQNRKATTSVKYKVNYANWHFGLYGQFGGYDEGNGSKGAFEGAVGADWNVGPGVLSFDAIGGYTKDAVTVGLGGQVDQFGNPIGLATFASTMSATITNNANAMIAAKYTMDRLKLYAGYEWIQLANGDPTGTFTDIAGDVLCNPGCGNLTSINSTPFTHGVDKIVQIFWAGAKYSVTDALEVSGAYYHEDQNDFSGGATAAANGATGSLPFGSVACSVNSKAQSSCAGTIDAVSFVLDYKFAPKWDTYIGTLYSTNKGGLDSGFEASSNWATTAGVRFRW